MADTAKKTVKYETIMILNSALGEEAVAELTEKFKKLISKNGTIESVDDWGKRRLAYPIDDLVEGNYVLVNFTAEPTFPAELERIYGITDGVLRTIVIAREED